MANRAKSRRMDDDPTAARLLAMLTSGGDDRIRADANGRNRYHATIMPFSGAAYGSSTINSISVDALGHLAGHWYPRVAAGLSAIDYAAALDELRQRVSVYYAGESARVVFAASGTDLEYVGLATVPANTDTICAILLGRDEVGSGCVHSAAGRFFAERTATGIGVAVGSPIDARHAATRLADLPIRNADGTPRGSDVITADIERLADAAIAKGEHPVIHIVHGSKTGLTLPVIDDCARLAERYGARATLVVDACQLRISPAAVRGYLALGATVLATGSKFAGGAPFSGFALVPARIMQQAAPLSAGFTKLSRRAEWPVGWPERDALPDEANAGLLLRLAGALFEIDRFLALDGEQVSAIIADFRSAIISSAAATDLALLAAQPDQPEPLAASLVTLDLSHSRPHLDFDAAVALHRTLALADGDGGAAPFRIGQPVRTRRLDSGAYAACVRVALSMPMLVEHARLPRHVSQQRFDAELSRICSAIADQADAASLRRDAA